MNNSFKRVMSNSFKKVTSNTFRNIVRKFVRRVTLWFRSSWNVGLVSVSSTIVISFKLNHLQLVIYFCNT